MLDIVKLKYVPADAKDASSLAVRKMLYVPASSPNEEEVMANVPAGDQEMIPPGIFTIAPALPLLGTNEYEP